MSQIPDLSPAERRALLNELLEKRATQSGPLKPLSHGQRSLWFLSQLAPESTAYNLVFAWRFLAPIDVAALERAFQALVDRHPILRTTYVAEAGEPFQDVHPSQRVFFEEVDLRGADDEELLDRVTALVRQPFDLQMGPVFRVHLLRRSVRECIQLVSMHHIAGDMRSVELLMSELRECYQAETRGIRWSPPPLSSDYLDHVEWQRRLLAGKKGEALWDYWRSELAGELPLLNLPSDHARPRTQTYNGATHIFDLSSICAQARSLSGTEGATLYVTVLAAFNALLGRLAKQTDIIVGSPSLGRGRPEFADVIGYFVNPVIYRTDLSGDPSFRELMHQVRRTVLGALDHQDYPFPLLVEKLEADRDPGRSPITDVYFVWDRLSQEKNRMTVTATADETRFYLDWGDIQLESVDLTHGGTPSDLVLLIMEIDDTLTGSMSYNTDLFDTETVVRLAGLFRTLLDDAVRDPDKRISELALLTTEEKALREKLSHARNPDWLSQGRRKSCLHALFEDSCRSHPSSVAVVYESEELTYSELNSRANQLAHHLLQKGVENGAVVGLSLDRSIDLVIAILGILKAGAAYVPLDPTYPAERLTYMLEDSGAKFVVSSSRNPVPLSGTGCQIVDLEVDRESLAAESDQDPNTAVTDEGLAYVIYTSGSTGAPKGVMVTHRNVVRLFDSTQRWFDFGSNDVWSLFHSCSFDFSVWEIWGALLYGGKLSIVPYWVSRSPETFYRYLETEKITVLNQTPSAFRQLIWAEDQAEEGRDLSLRWVIFGGEALDLASLEPWFLRHGDQHPRLVNMYGITETTVHVTYRLLTAEDARSGEASLIGTALPDLSLYILDDQLQVVPVGVVGEIYVGGAGVARGYLNRPELSAERFLDDPFSEEIGDRLYKTGDLARWRSDGDLEYIGRADSQVQVRGFRVELGEIESVLSGVEEIRETTVILREDTPGDQRLVAYFLPMDSHTPSAEVLREHARERLPEYMVPAAYVALERFPMTPNGKLDRAALPRPIAVLEGVSGESAESSTETEKRLVGIWSEILGVHRVGVRESFFDLGGHSLLATQIVSRMRDEFGVEISLRQFFEQPTVAAISAQIEALKILEAGGTEEVGDADGNWEEFEI